MQLITTLTTALLTTAASAGLAPTHPHHGAARGSPAGSPGCNKSPPVEPGEWIPDQTTASGREYRIFLPLSYDPGTPAPLVLSYHGASANIDRQAQLDQLSDPKFNTDHVVVYLQGARREPDNAKTTTWQGAPGAPADDIAFTADVLDAVESQLCVDAARIFATGHSQGGGFVGRLACDPELSKRIAAFAPVSGAFYNTAITTEAQCDPRSMDDVCNTGRGDVPILELHGGDDDTISFHGGFRKGACLPTIRHWTKDWARRDGLDLNDTVVPIGGTDNGVQYVYGDGLVTLVYAGDDVGHVWMSKDAGNADIDASTWVMDFFQKHTL